MKGLDNYLFSGPHEDPDIPVDELENELKKLSSPHNRDCWKLCSFGWKDADLDATGCQGISAVEYPNEEQLLVTYGAHKTVCNPTYELEYELSDKDREEYSNLAFEIVSGFGAAGDWTGDDWCLYTDGTVRVDWLYSDDETEYDCKKTAQAIVDAVTKEFEEWNREAEYLDESLGHIYDEIEEKYGIN